MQTTRMTTLVASSTRLRSQGPSLVGVGVVACANVLIRKTQILLVRKVRKPSAIKIVADVVGDGEVAVTEVGDVATLAGAGKVDSEAREGAIEVKTATKTVVVAKTAATVGEVIEVSAEEEATTRAAIIEDEVATTPDRQVTPLQMPRERSSISRNSSNSNSSGLTEPGLLNATRSAGSWSRRMNSCIPNEANQPVSFKFNCFLRVANQHLKLVKKSLFLSTVVHY